ncbi:hypothetical protein SAMN02745225_01621 [Ferrithrix thermotolerans DSM 19514]|uniref:Uncharacterized protein n=1 Tax=Ferrithrix thermotolerans DSM 19514 TaxID=1121881 RepID=A0A1M4WC90_9ACTN|nr:hypothetical protein SAMN02745225_01621 [Ferrithrix thermotolerans DSM 19514]
MLCGNPYGPGPHERVKDTTAPPVSPAFATRRDRSEAIPSPLPDPGLSASAADAIGAAGEDRTPDKVLREDGEVRAPVAGCRHSPDVAGVLAERMSRPSFGTGALQAVVGSCERSSPGRPAPAVLGVDHDRTRPAGRLVRYAHNVQVEVVALRSDKEVDGLPGGREAVGDRVWHGVRLGPDDLVAHGPATFGQGKQEPLGRQEQALCQCAVARPAREAVAEVQEEAASRCEHSGELVADGDQVLDVGVDVGLGADLLLSGAVAAQQVVWR